MLHKFRPRSVYDVFAVLALFVALGGTSAVALSGSNTVFSDDIADDNFSSPTEGQGGLVASDLRAGSVTSSEVADSSLTGADVFNNTISGADITNGSLTGADVFDNTIASTDITNNSLTGTDVNESTLSVIQGTGKVFAGSDSVASGESGDLVTVPSLGTFSLQCETSQAVARFTPVSGLGDYRARLEGNSTTGAIPVSFGTAASPDPAAFVIPSRSVIGLRIVKSGALMATLELDVSQADTGLPCNYSFQLLATS